jgi:hypothetical protein
MSKILKRPMFRIGGSTNEGIVSMAVPKRAGYQEPTGAATTLDNYKIDPNDPLFREAMKNAAMMSQFAGAGRSRDSRLSDLLIRGGLKTLSERPAGNIFATVGKAFTPAVDEYLKGEDTEESFQRQLRLAGLTSAMTSRENREKYNKELDIAKMKIEQGEKELFLKSNSELGSKAIGVWETMKKLKRQGVDIEEGVVSSTKVKDVPKPVQSDVAQIPEGRVFRDNYGFFYKRVKEGPGWVRIQTSGENIPAPPVVQKTESIGAAYDPRSWNKQKFYESLAKKNTPSTME